MASSPPTDTASCAEPIAIIGIGCRFPGGARGPERFWQLLCDGVDAVTEIPPDRWNIRKFFDPDPRKPGKTYSRWGGFIDGVDQFDPAFFRISAREAAMIDPQQRVLLEVAWEALEDAGQVVDWETSSDTGVFIGISMVDYDRLQYSPFDRSRIEVHSCTAGAVSIAANRISYCLNLSGPSIAVDTACSSSLVAVHLACRSLRDRECSVALAGGVNLNFRAEPFIAFSKTAMLSPDGRCKAFSADANGYVRGEGAGVIVLKPLAAALADADPIYAVIRGTAVNEDGRTQGITLPSQRAQQSLVREACRAGGVSPGLLRYVEAHGTGTAVGDPIEANALGAALSQDRTAGSTCFIGSVKTNIGHLESAAGMAGIIKTALVLDRRAVPPNLHFERPNPEIDFDALHLRVPTTLQSLDVPSPDLPPKGGSHETLLFGGVNSFGFGGANAHAVLQSSPNGWHPHTADQTSDGTNDRRVQLLTVSAHSPEALQAAARNLVDFLGPQGEGRTRNLRDICYTANRRRYHHAHRLAVVGCTHDDVAAHLDELLSDPGRATAPTRITGSDRHRKIAFAFGGQGPQWWAMGRELLDERTGEPVFRQKVQECERVFRSIAGDGVRTLWTELHCAESDSRVHEVAAAHQMIFALQVGLAALWRSWGIAPAVVVGHSIGEIAAAHVAGILDLEDAARLVVHRGICLERLGVTGKMLAVGLARQDAQDLLAGRGQDVWLAAINSVSSVTLSGDAAALAGIASDLERRQVHSKFLRVTFPYHSGYLDPMRDDFRAALQTLTPRPAAIPMMSTVTGTAVDGPELDADYWWLNARHPVLFAPAMSAIVDSGVEAFVEISPHPVLAASMHECLRSEGRQAVVVPSLRREEPERRVMLESLGALHVLGVPVAWPALDPGGGRCVRLPSYPWQRERFWHEAPECREGRLGAPVHPLLSRDLASAQPSWEVKADMRILTWLRDHQVRGRAVFPAAAYVEMALAAARQILGPVPCVLEEIEIHKPLFPGEGDQAPVVQLLYDPQDGSFRIHSRLEAASQPWTMHCLGRIRPERALNGRSTPSFPTVDDIWNRLDGEITSDEHYAHASARGLQYGPCFQGLKRIRQGQGEAIGEIALPSELQSDAADYQVHPALLDACFQLFLPAGHDRPNAAHPPSDVLYLPVRIDKVRVHEWPHGRAWGHLRVTRRDSRILRADVRVVDEASAPAIEIQGLHCQAVGDARSDKALDSFLYEWTWHVKPLNGRRTVRDAGFLPDVHELGRTLRNDASQLGASLGWGQPSLSVLDDLCHAYVVRAFEELGWPLAAGERVDERTLFERLRILPQHERLVRRLLTTLMRDGLLRQADGTPEWIVTRAPEPVALDQQWRTLPFEHAALHPELALMERCGRHLAGVLRGEVDSTELLMPGGSTATLEHLYDSSRTYRMPNTMVRGAVLAAIERLPEGRRLRILEVGGGTGGTTVHVLRGLPAERVEYLFTDTSAAVLSRAEQRFAAYPFVRYATFDIDKPPADQGIANGDFDVVIAAGVLHETADVRAALATIRNLLAPGGWLVLMELATSCRWVDIVFGPVDPASPFLDGDRWQTLLEHTGFIDVEPMSDAGGAAAGEMTVLLARNAARELDAGESITWAAERTEDTGPDQHGDAEIRSRARPVPPRLRGDVVPCTPSPPLSARDGVVERDAAESIVTAADDACWLIFSDRGGVARALADSLERTGQRCVLVDHEHELDTTVPYRGIVHLWSLDISADSLTSLIGAEERGCHSVLRLVQNLARSGPSPQLWLITRGAQAASERSTRVCAAQAALIGLGRVVISEHPQLRCRLVDLDPEGTDDAAAQAVFDEIVANEEDDEIALRGEGRFVHRLERTSFNVLRPSGSSGTSSECCALETPAPGALDSIVLRRRARRPPGRGEVEIDVCASGLNFRDVLKALGLIRPDGGDAELLGEECAGRICAVGEGVTAFRTGDEVLAFGIGCHGSHVTTNEALVVRKPAHLSFEEAATIPLVFLTADYALRHVGRLKAGERVLIHAATGGVGLAAIQIARLAGAEVLATAGSREKREYLRAIGVEHVMDSRSLDFGEDVLHATGGEGVDLVLNSLAGHAIATGLSCLRDHGRFLEIGKLDILSHTRVDLHPFRKCLSFSAIDLSSTLRRETDLTAQIMRELVARFEQRLLHPLPHRTFPIAEALPALRHMAQAKHVGKIVLSVRDRRGVTPRPAQQDASLTFAPDATYLIAGGLGGFGIGVARWMVANGARHLALMGRSAPSTQVCAAVEDMERQGATIVTVRADVTSEDDVAQTLTTIGRTMPPLRGIVHAAMVLDDDLVVRLDADRFRRVTAPKVLGAWNLHTLTLGLPLEFFVMFSSISAMLGSPGQASYAAANAFLDALAHQRRRAGLPALTVNWGRLGDVGYVVQHPALEHYFSRIGIHALPLDQATGILGRLLRTDEAQVAAINVDWGTLGLQFMSAKRSSRFAHLVQESAAGADRNGGSTRDAILAAREDERHQLLEVFIRDTVARVLGTASARIATDRPLDELGMDSLMAIEVAMRLEADLGFSVPNGTVMGSYTVSRVAAAIGALLAAG